MDIKTKFTNLDILLAIIFGVSLVVPSIAQTYGLDVRLVWMPTICYILWTLITGFIKPNFLAADSVEISTIEKIKGWSYVVSLPIILILNFLLLQYAPRTGAYYLFTMLAVFSVAMLLRVTILSFPKLFFRQEVIYMKKEEEKLINKMLIEAGSASIWGSFSLLTVNGLIANAVNYSYLQAIIVPVSGISLLIVAYYRNRKASKFVPLIAESLINSNWYKKYSAKPK